MGYMKFRRFPAKAGAILLTVFVAFTFLDTRESSSAAQNHHHHRHLLQTDDGTSSTTTTTTTSTAAPSLENATEIPVIDPTFPEDLFTPYQLSHGAVVFHILGIIYMFYALALVCDEFFVPCLDVISEKLGISPDVAGATFMAAGGSAPELFTSIIGVFIAQNDVGIGTIVGSAVFNILFVIAACAFAAKEALSLTAWPLIRDVSFYSTSLILLVAFFMDNKIEWWEALVLFLWYIAYVSFMAVSERVEDMLRALFKLQKKEREIDDKGVLLRKAAVRRGLYHLMNETINKDILEKKRRTASQMEDGEEMKPLTKKGESGGGLMIMSNQAGSADGIGGVRPAAGISNLKNQLQDDKNVTGNDINVTDVEKSSSEGTATKPSEENNGQDLNNGAIDSKEVVGKQQPEEEPEEPIDMSFPRGQGWKKILVYIISFPIMGPLYVTLPDTKNPKKRKYFVITFTLSIVWIALYSYLMVWWATVAGFYIHIPPPVMGLTFLAAGTSVPDLITSVLVAKQGKGDMAVSSSVGSNIFDVTVGLPVPWLLYTIVFWDSVKVNSAGIGCSVSILFLMLIVVFLAIILFKWKMTRGMGAVMMFFYVVFVAVSLGFSYEYYTCPF